MGLALTKRILARGDRAVATARDTSRFDPLISNPETDTSRIFVFEVDVTSPFTAPSQSRNGGRALGPRRRRRKQRSAKRSWAERRIGVSGAGAERSRSPDALRADC